MGLLAVSPANIPCAHPAIQSGVAEGTHVFPIGCHCFFNEMQWGTLVFSLDSFDFGRNSQEDPLCFVGSPRLLKGITMGTLAFPLDFLDY